MGERHQPIAVGSGWPEFGWHNQLWRAQASSVVHIGHGADRDNHGEVVEELTYFGGEERCIFDVLKSDDQNVSTEEGDEREEKHVRHVIRPHHMTLRTIHANVDLRLVVERIDVVTGVLSDIAFVCPCGDVVGTWVDRRVFANLPDLLERLDDEDDRDERSEALLRETCDVADESGGVRCDQVEQEAADPQTNPQSQSQVVPAGAMTDRVHDRFEHQYRSCTTQNGQRLTAEESVHNTADCTAQKTFHGGLFKKKAGKLESFIWA